MFALLPSNAKSNIILAHRCTLTMTAGIPNRVGSYAEVAEDPDVEIVYVGMLHPFHYENALVALQNGKHVLVEKPSTCSLSDTRALAAMVRDCTNSPPAPSAANGIMKSLKSCSVPSMVSPSISCFLFVVPLSHDNRPRKKAFF